MADIFDEFKSKKTVEEPASTNTDDIFNEFKSKRSPTPEAPSPIKQGMDESIVGQVINRVAPPIKNELIPGAAKGFMNVVNTVNNATFGLHDTVDRLFKQPNKNLLSKHQEQTQEYNKLYAQNNPNPSALRSIGEVGGEIAASAPFIPAGAISHGVKSGMGALPTILASGEKVAAPLVNRLGASAVSGGIVGSQFGTLTSAGTDDSLIDHVGKNALGGVVGGPVIETAGALASKVSPAIRRAAGNYSINRTANKYGITPQAARDLFKALDNEGMTLAQAEAKLASFGPDATIGDLTPALQQFVGALSKRGELSTRAATIIKNRYANRAETADERAVDDIVNRNLGPHKDISLERGKLIGQAADDIHEAAQLATSADRKAAHANPTKLSVYSLIGDINSQLESAAGAKATALKEAKGYLYKTVKDPNTGVDVQQVRTSVKDLHESRIALDDLIEKQGDSLPPRALSVVKDIRKKVDAQLKTIPEMAAHDVKFAEQMKVKEGLKIGYEALKKGNKFSFDDAYDSATPEVKQTIREGMRAYIGDYMDKAAKGELSGVANLLADRGLTRHKLVKAFGANGDEALKALEKHLSMRATERFASQGSITNAAERINSALDQTASPKSAFGEMVSGAITDLSFGMPGQATAIRGAKAGGGNILERMKSKRHDLNVESLADLVSRSGTDRDMGITVLQTVERVQNKLKVPSREIKLPVILSAPIGEQTIKEGKDISKKLNLWY